MKMITIDHKEILSMLPDRKPTTHKYQVGKVLILGGSIGYTGSVALSAMGALRCGAGMVYLGVPESIYSIEATKLTEPVVFPLPSYDGEFSEEAAKRIEKLLLNIDVVVIGPGMRCGTGAVKLLEMVMKSFIGPVVVDADGINCLATHKNMLCERAYPTIITPHEGEYRRLAGSISGDRIVDASRMAKECGATVLLKGHHTVVTDGYKCYINETGNPGMATGGCGDVLAGIIGAMLGHKLSPFYACACGAWLHGAAGDYCAKELGQYAMLPSDLINALPRFLK